MSRPRAILHVDMDAFYASVEQRDNPSLRGKPLIVGAPPVPGKPNRGVVLAASYEARPFGVRSALPMARALKLAPHALVVPPRHAAYAEASEQVFAILSSVTPLVEPLSLDEAFLDVTASQGIFGTPVGMARHLRQRIAQEVRLPASAGIAPVKFIAKIASDLAKPNGQKEVTVAEVRPFLDALPVGRLWGVGPRTEEILKRLGLTTVGDVARRDAAWLERHLGSAGTHLWELSQGRDERDVIPDHAAKSVGAEDTFDEDLDGAEALKPHLHGQALQVGRRLRRAGVRTRVVQLKIKYADFALTTRRLTLDESTDDGQVLYRAAVELLEREPLRTRVRLTGVSAQDLDGGGDQLPLFAPPGEKASRLNTVMDKINDKFGRGALTTADLAREGDGPQPLRRGRGRG